MYPAMTEMDPVHSGTGVFYQAIPAVGANGKNIMKLIPVQMVNGQSVKSRISLPKTAPTPQKAVTVDAASAPVQILKRAASNPYASQQIARKPVSLLNASSNQVGVDLGNLLNKHLVQQQNANLMAIVPPMATTVKKGWKSGRLPSQLPVTVNYPALPSGHYPQSPLNTRGQTVQASELPLGIKKHIFTSSASSPPSSSLHSAANVSSITSINPDVDAQSDYALETLKLLHKMANKTSCGPPSTGSKPHLRLIPMVSQRANSPIKWVIQEEDSSTAPTLDPIDSSVTSDILRVVAERENAQKHDNFFAKPGQSLDPIHSSVTSEILRVAAEREKASKYNEVITKPGPSLEPINSSVMPEILRVAAKRKNGSKDCGVSTKPVSGSSKGKNGQGKRNTLVMNKEKHPIKDQYENLMATSPLATLATKSTKSRSLPSQLPVTVNSPAFHSGHYLQIPRNAQVQIAQASELPPGVMEHMVTSSAKSSLSSGLPSAAYISPFTSINPGVDAQRDSALDMRMKSLCKIANTTSCGPPSTGSKPPLKLIPKVSQRPNSPIKWVIQEEDSSTAPTLDSSVTSECLRLVAERENAEKFCKVIKEPVSRSSQGKGGQGQENPLIMCKGKVFFVAKNGSLPHKMENSDSPTAARKSNEFNKTTIYSSQQAHKSDEVIDLCDDDAHDDSSQQAAPAVTHPDEDRVEFVSYIAPKSKETQDLRLKRQMALVKETDQMGTSSLNSVTEQKSLDGTTGALTRRKPDQSMSVNTVQNLPHVCGTAVESMDDDAKTKGPTGPSPSDGSSGRCSQIQKDAHKKESSMNPATSWTSSPAPESCQIDDHQLRQIFGITADVKICLRRIDGVSLGSLPAETLLQTESIRSVEGRQKPMSGLKDLYGPQEPGRCSRLFNVKQNLPEDSDIRPLNFTLNTKPISVLKNKCHLHSAALKGLCDVETEPAIGYIEPIDEDFLGTDENDTAARQQTQTCVDLNTNTRRMGRKRKRTTCPCCVPCVQGPTGKSRKEEREKAVRKDVKISRKINCLTAKSKHSCTPCEDPASDSFSTTSLDSDELKLRDQINKLKGVLQEKEAALELMRNVTT